MYLSDNVRARLRDLLEVGLATLNYEPVLCLLVVLASWTDKPRQHWADLCDEVETSLHDTSDGGISSSFAETFSLTN